MPGSLRFRYIPVGKSSTHVDIINQQLVDAMIADGFAMVSSTTLRGHTVLRLCTINPRTRESDLRETLQRLEDYGNKLSSSYDRL